MSSWHLLYLSAPTLIQIFIHQPRIFHEAMSFVAEPNVSYHFSCVLFNLYSGWRQWQTASQREPQLAILQSSENEIRA